MATTTSFLKNCYLSRIAYALLFKSPESQETNQLTILI